MKWNYVSKNELPKIGKACFCNTYEAYRIMYRWANNLWYICDSGDNTYNSEYTDKFNDSDIIGWVYLDDVISTIEK